MRGVPQVDRDGQRAAALDVAHGRPVRLAGSDRLGGRREIDRRLGQRVLRLGQADPVERLRGRHGHLEGARVGVADVLGGADDQPPGDEPGSSPAAIMAASQ